MTTTPEATGSLSGVGTGATGTDLTVVVLLVVLLIAKEIATSVPGPRARLVGRILDVGLAPLALVFAGIVALRLLRAF